LTALSTAIAERRTTGDLPDAPGLEQKPLQSRDLSRCNPGAGEGIRTLDPNLGKGWPQPETGVKR
jgi:hypothetical protein